MFKTLVGKEIAVELKNDVALTGTLHSIDQYLNIKLLDARASSTRRGARSCGRVVGLRAAPWVRCVQLPAADVDAELLQATRAARRA